MILDRLHVKHACIHIVTMIACMMHAMHREMRSRLLVASHLTLVWLWVLCVCVCVFI